jgi:Ran GTPase-activating protein (RanGAP) involved in mRNA processing and transport
MTTLNLSSNKFVPEWAPNDPKNLKYGEYFDGSKFRSKEERFAGITALANAIIDMGAILSVNLLKNDIPLEQAKVLANILKDHPTLKSLCGNNGDETELDMSGMKIGAEGASMLAPEIAGNRALTSLNLATNSLYAEGTKLLAEVLKGNKIMTELNISSNAMTHGGMSGLVALADAIPDMGALTLLDISDNVLGATGGAALAAGLKGNQVITELNIASNYLGLQPGGTSDMSGVIALTDAMKDMGAISIVNLRENSIQFSNELCATLLRCAIDSRCGLRIQIEEGNDFSAVNKHTMEFILLELLGKEDTPTEVNVESAGLTGITLAVVAPPS